MHPEQDLEGAQELPLCVDPGSGKDFMDAAGYVTPVGRLPPVSQAPVVNRDSAQPRPQPGNHFHLPSPALQDPEKGPSGRCRVDGAWQHNCGAPREGPAKTCSQCPWR